MAVAHQIALALEAAHEKGVLHRDLKPGNIRLAPDGRVKLLDFGLACAVRAVAFDPRLDTETSPHNEPGAVLGTAPYMSPEQARGQDVDRRGDVWAFGSLLFEMLAGKRAFEGATFSDTVAAVLDHEPDWEALPKETPPAVVRLLRRCLQKEREKRLRDIGDARLELEAESVPAGEVLLKPRPPRWPAIALLSAVLGGFVSWVIQRTPSVRKEVIRFSVDAPPESFLSTLLLSPTGERIVYGSPSGLVVRELDKPEGRVIPGTAGAYRPSSHPTASRAARPFCSPRSRAAWRSGTTRGSRRSCPEPGSAARSWRAEPRPSMCRPAISCTAGELPFLPHPSTSIVWPRQETP